MEDKIAALLASPESMEQIMSIAKMFSGGEAPKAAETKETPVPDILSGLGGIDPALLTKGLSLLREYNTNDSRQAALLLALKPYLKHERHEKIDKAIQIARLARVAKAIFIQKQD